MQSSKLALGLLSILLFLGACGSGTAPTDEGASADRDRPTVVVTTNILGDVVHNLVGDHFEVVTLMPVGSDPHDFQPSAQEIAQLETADAIIVNGGGFEEGLLDVVEGATEDGVPVFEALSVVNPLAPGDEQYNHDEHDADDHDADDHDADEHHNEGEDYDDHGHHHGGTDPHFFADPARMLVAAQGVMDFLIDTVDGADAEALQADAAPYLAELSALDEEVESILAEIPEHHRTLLTNHEVYAYFADRYAFTLVGAVIPGGSTTDAANAQDLAALAEKLMALDAPAVFTDTSSSDELAQVLAEEVGDVPIVELYSESLGAAGSDGATYLDMVRTNAQRIASALAAGDA